MPAARTSLRATRPPTSACGSSRGIVTRGELPTSNLQLPSSSASRPPASASRYHTPWKLEVGRWKLTGSLLVRGLRDLEHLPGLDLVGVAELVLIRVEDVHVGAVVPEHLLRDLAERIARVHRVSLF